MSIGSPPHEHNYTETAVLGGAGGYTVGAGQTLTIDAVNTHTGAVRIQNGGTLKIASNRSSNSNYNGGITILSGGRFEDCSQNYGGYPNSTVYVKGVSAADASGYYVWVGSSRYIYMEDGPSTIRKNAAAGSALLRGFDVNDCHLACRAAASGSKIAADVAVLNGGYGYHIDVASGANNATGDLEILGTINSNMNLGFGLVFSGTGHVVLSGSAPTYGASDCFIEMNAQFGGGVSASRLRGKLTFGGAFQMNGGNSAVRIRQSTNGTDDGTIEWASSATQTISGVWSGSRPVIISGTGPLTLTGANTRTGTTTVKSGAKLALANTNPAPHTVESGGTLSSDSSQSGTTAALTFSAAGSKYEVNALTASSVSRLTATALTAASGFTVDMLGALDSGTYTILACTASLPSTLPTIGTNTTGKQVAFAWVAGTGLVATVSANLLTQGGVNLTQSSNYLTQG